MERAQTVFLSQLLGERLHDPGGKVVGHLRDLVTRQGDESGSVYGYLVRGKEGGSFWVGAGDLLYQPRQLLVPRPEKSMRLYQERPEYILLGEDVMDQQVIDLRGRKVIRVNDIQLKWQENTFRILGADIGPTGFLRRLGGSPLATAAAVLIRPWRRPRILPWPLIEPLGRPGEPLKLAIPWEKMKRLRPADLADIIDDLDRERLLGLFQAMDDAEAAEALSEVEDPATRKALLELLGPDRASDILEEMSPDDAADVLGDLPEHSAREYLDSMEEEERRDLTELLHYPETTAGGLMTTEYIALDQTLTAEETIALLRRLAPDAETIYYLYVVDTEGRLVGVLSLRDLIVAAPTARLEQVMTGQVVSVPVEADQETVVDVMARYDFLALPVVDGENHLKGIITIDDVMDVALERGGWTRQIFQRGR
ncbi:MAG TPA: CBS domain-containing protein [Firmicutes bacterium]|nr:CBS domain-containing protein [Bacillota bacterium]